MPLEHVVHKMTQDTARLYGMHDRGVLAPGYRADVNVIDHEHAAPARPARWCTTSRPAASGSSSGPAATS